MLPNSKLLVPLLGLLLSTPLAAHNAFLDLQYWQVQADVNIQNGKIYERVFEGSHKLSELEWEVKGVPMGVLTASYTYSPAINWHFSLWSRLMNEGHGKIVDRDWFNDASATPTHTSFSNAPITRAHGYTLSVDALLSHIADYDVSVAHFPYSLHLQAAQVRGLLGYKTSLYRWVAHGAQLNYPEGIFTISTNATTLWYEQRLRAPFIGLAYTSTIDAGMLTVQATATSFATADDLDKHYLRDIIFEGEFHLAHWYTLEAHYLYPITDKFTLHIGYSLDWMPTRRGNTLIKEPGNTIEIADSAGIAHRTHNYMLGLKHQF